MAITQSCPRCRSDRIRRGYRPTPFFSKIIGRYHLLCDNCNWEFTGFAVPGTFSFKNSKKKTKTKSDLKVENKVPTRNMQPKEKRSEIVGSELNQENINDDSKAVKEYVPQKSFESMTVKKKSGSSRKIGTNCVVRSF